MFFLFNHICDVLFLCAWFSIKKWCFFLKLNARKENTKVDILDLGSYLVNKESYETGMSHLKCGTWHGGVNPQMPFRAKCHRLRWHTYLVIISNFRNV